MSTLTRLADCGRRPNCVSATASDPRRRIELWPLTMVYGDAWPAIREAVEQLPRTRIVVADNRYLRAESRSLVCRFVDDLELVVIAGPDRIGVRSASRVGITDRGVNRRRVRTLEGVLAARGVIES